MDMNYSNDTQIYYEIILLLKWTRFLNTCFDLVVLSIMYIVEIEF